MKRLLLLLALLVGAPAFAAGVAHHRQSYDPVAATLQQAGMGHLMPHVTHMLYPKNAPSDNRHYLYRPDLGGWSATGTTITGTMEATGVVSGGTFRYIAPVTTVSTYTIKWLGTVSFCIGFNRSLTAGDQAALASTAWWEQLFAGTAIAVGDCAGEYGESITVDGVQITVDGGPVTVGV